MCRVLLVEDESTTREFLRTLLIRSGHQVEAAACARDSEEALTRIDPEISIIDLLLPDTNGDVLAQELRSQLPHPLGVVFITGLSGHDLRRRLNELEPCVLLQKPFANEELLQAVGDLLKRDTARSA